MICASITEKTITSMVRIANKVNADLVELRLDFLRKFDKLDKISKIKKPVIATCMPVWEGGRFKKSEEKRIKILKQSLDFVNYVTIELKTKPFLQSKLIKKARRKKVKVIVAFHNFEKTPSKNEILKIIDKEKKIGDIAKVAFMPKNNLDVLNLMNALLTRKKTKVIALSMGKLGRVSRVLAPIFGSYLTYGSVSRGREAGPGQLTVDELTSILSTFNRK